jgi:4'-phosphopantetheinyl transferase
LHEVHVWDADLRAWPPRDCLSREERERAGRLRFPADRTRFAAARTMLRSLAGAYLGIDPRDVALANGPHGKPMLADRGTALRFSVAHAGDIALFAFACGREVGVDLEPLADLSELDLLVARFCTPDARAALARLDPGSRLAAFYGMWTRMEAQAKARGTGLLRPDRHCEERSDEAIASPQLLTLDLGYPGCAAALAIERHPRMSRGRGRLRIHRRHLSGAATCCTRCLPLSPSSLQLSSGSVGSSSPPACAFTTPSRGTPPDPP